jgi:hypothetical protein
MRTDGRPLPGFLIALQTSVRGWSGDIRIRLARTTPRERLLLVGLAAGALIYAPVAAAGWRAEQEDLYIDALSERGSARIAAAAARRVAGAPIDDAALQDMRAWGFEGTNLDVVKVRIEQRLTQAAAAAGIVNPQIAFGEEAEVEGPTSWLRADIEADLVWSPAFVFLDAIAAWPEGFRVLGFEYDGYAQPIDPVSASDDDAVPARRPTRSGPPKLRLALAFPLAETIETEAP